MSFQKIMAQLMADAEPLEALVGDVRCVQNAECVAVPEQHAGDSACGVWLWPDFYLTTAGDGKRIDRQRRDPLVA